MIKTIKIISRIAHMFTVAILSGAVILNYMFDLRATLKDEPAYKRLIVISGVILMISGFCNIFLIKGKKKLKPEHKLWGTLLKLKFLITLIFLTPLINPILSIFTGNQDEIDILRTKVQFYLVLCFFVYSTLVKHFREDICNNFEDDEVFKKVQELQKKYDQGELIKGVVKSDEYKDQ